MRSKWLRSLNVAKQFTHCRTNPFDLLPLNYPITVSSRLLLWLHSTFRVKIVVLRGVVIQGFVKIVVPYKGREYTESSSNPTSLPKLEALLT